MVVKTENSIRTNTALAHYCATKLLVFVEHISSEPKTRNSINLQGWPKKIAPLTKCHNFFLHRDNNLKFLPFFYNDILRSCLKFYDEILRSNKMTAI